MLTTRLRQHITPIPPGRKESLLITNELAITPNRRQRNHPFANSSSMYQNARRKQARAQYSFALGFRLLNIGCNVVRKRFLEIDSTTSLRCQKTGLQIRQRYKSVSAQYLFYICERIIYHTTIYIHIHIIIYHTFSYTAKIIQMALCARFYESKYNDHGYQIELGLLFARILYKLQILQCITACHHPVTPAQKYSFLQAIQC
ncbi:Hypothetical_protein [Hexamita inflata]|uniref:Hypothetical_protein n=1 Tax=Hexamita inflata TaxID=28002 RepID=A0AA86V440_9EUKA|nr:Hypothetical protein HINF_LOCUS63391 [Hexamita inflata]